MIETWEPIDDFGYPGYSVSSDGRVRNDETDHILRTSVNRQGVVKVGLVEYPGWPQRTVSIARLVATFFLPPPPSPAYDTPVHLDGDFSNNRYTNLMWRPRWFAIRYHRQRSGPLYSFMNPIVCIDTDEVFEDCRQAAQHYGMLEESIFLDVTNQDGVWPHRYLFALLDENYYADSP